MSERPNPQQELSETIRAAAAGEGESPTNYQETVDYSGRNEYQLFDKADQDFTNDYPTTYQRHDAATTYWDERRAVDISVGSEKKIVDLNSINEGSQVVEDNGSMKVDTKFSDGYKVRQEINWDKNRHDGDPVIRTEKTTSDGEKTETYKKMSPRQQRAAARLARISFGIKKDEDPVETEKAA